MKKLTLGVAIWIYVVGAFSQGTVRFDNDIPGTVITHVYGPDPANPLSYKAGFGSNDFNLATGGGGNLNWAGEPLAGSNFSAQIYAAGGADAPLASLRPASPVTSFRTGSGAGFFVATIATLAGVPLDAPVATLQVRIWDNEGGTVTSWENAIAFGKSSAFGQSPLFNLSSIGGGLNAPQGLIGLQSFNITSIPEPSPIALVGLGTLVSLALARRRKT